MSLKSVQTAFFSQLADPSCIRSIFDFVPDVYFFVKNNQGELIAASSAILVRLGLRSEADLVGRSDHDVFPRHLADAYAEDDAFVIRSAKPLVNRLELWIDEHGQPDWCVTTKVPLFDSSSRVIGLMGLTRRESNQAVVQPANEVTRAVKYVRENADRVLTAAELANAACTSERTLHRKIAEAFGVPPYEWMLRLRVQLAAEALLKPDAIISNVANAFGFCDQSSFTQHFRKRIGTTPKAFMTRHEKSLVAQGP